MIFPSLSTSFSCTSCLYIHMLDQTPQPPILKEIEWNMNDSLINECLNDYILHIFTFNFHTQMNTVETYQLLKN